MGMFQSMPPLNDEEYKALAESIKEHGVQVPVIEDEHGEMIDGHHRQKIAADLGIDCPAEIRTGLSDQEKRTLALTLNVDRRHLTAKQRRDLIAASLKADPKLSLRAHARRTGASDHTVKSVRDELEGTAQIAQFDQTTGTDGKSRPARKASAKKSESSSENGHKKGKAKTVSKRRAAELAEEEAIADSIRASADQGYVLAGKRTRRVVAADERLRAALSETVRVIIRAVNDPDLDVELIRADQELHKDAQLDTLRLELSRQVETLRLKLKALRDEAKTSSMMEESPDGE